MQRVNILSAIVFLLLLLNNLYAQDAIQLSIDDSVLLSLEKNLGLKVERYNPSIASQDILIEEGAFDPSLNFDFSQTYDKSLSPSIVTSTERRSHDMALSLTGKIETGTEYSLEWSYQRFRGDSTFLTLNPYHLTELNLIVSQPLLKGFGKETQTAMVRAAGEDLDASKYQFREEAENLIVSTIKAFYDVLLAQESLEIAEFSLSLAEKILLEVRAKIKAGLLAPVEIYAAEAEVSQREELLLSVENNLEDARDLLKRVLGVQDWDTEVALIKPETPSPELPNLGDSLQDALRYRSDLKQALLEKDKKRILTRFYKNQNLPDLSIFGGISFSGLGDSTSDAFDRFDDGTDNNWQIGLSLQIPIFMRESRGRYLRAKYEESQAGSALKDLRQQIELEVRQGLRALSLSIKKMRASRRTRIAREKRLQAEDGRFSEGITILNDLLQFQDEYARSLFDEKKSEFDYHLSIAAFEKMKGTILHHFGISSSEFGLPSWDNSGNQGELNARFEESGLRDQ
jgi:outer membrane protein TolC